MSATHRVILSYLSTQLQSKDRLSIVDYGSGSGNLLDLLDPSQIKTYLGWDINTSSIQAAQQKYGRKNIQFKLIKDAGQFSLGKPASADAVVCVGVLQYMTERQIKKLLAESNRVLKKNGVVIISCAVDHLVYRLLDLYQLFMPHQLTQRQAILKQLITHQFKVEISREKGLMIAPIFSNLLCLIFDALDKVIFQTKGVLGPIGRLTRRLMEPLIWFEYQLQLDFGYTLFILARKM